MSTTNLPPGADLSNIPSGPPPPGVTPNFDHPVTLSNPLVAVSLTCSILALTLVTARLYSTIRITRTFGSDDYSAIVALMFSFAYTGILIWDRGFARHIWDLALSSYTANFSESLFVGIIMSSLGLLSAKISILLLLLRLFSSNRIFRYLVYSAMTLTIVIHAFSIILAGVLCAPRAGEAFGSQILAQRCTKYEVWAIVQGAFEVLLDVWIFVLPLPIIWKLHMTRRRKLGVSIIFMTALTALVASVIGLAYRISFDSADPLWNSFVVIICAVVDLNVAIMVACMPPCASFGRYIFSSLKTRVSHSGSKSKSNANSSDGTNHSGSNGKYWRIKSPFTKENANPRSTAERKDSILQTIEFDVVQNKAQGSPFSEERGLGV